MRPGRGSWGSGLIAEASTVPGGTHIDRDVCIIGAGAAGTVLALDLARRGLSVCLLESGGAGLQSSVQALYRGAADAESFLGNDDYLWSSRLRFLGGTTNHWQGECERLDAEDFAAREWIPHSGWPIDADLLAPWYEHAAGWLELDDGSPLPEEAALPDFTTARRRWSPPTRFGPRYQTELAAQTGVLLLLRANAIALHSNEAGSRVEAVEVAAHLGAQRFRVRAGHTVLAAGALENARLLLASPARPGNAHDQVGRYFMDGIEGRVASVVALKALPLAAHDGPRSHPSVAVSPALQREQQLLNTRFVLEPLAQRPTGYVGALGSLAASVAAEAGDEALAVPRPTLQRVVLCTAMAPNPDNRVTLSDQRDALGMPRLALDAKPGELERKSILAATRSLATRLGAQLRGRLRLDLDPADPWSGLAPAQHPSGTTRMHEDPREGVVDANCRVHGLANLFVAGSSVFPSCGHARPTWTLLALGLRLAEHVSNLPKERT
jgi:choline dehydrogenase-like flavoprotein